MQQHKKQNQGILKKERYHGCGCIIILGSPYSYVYVTQFILFMVPQTKSFHQNAKLSLKLELPEILDGS